jgi:hypothetical protein
LKIATKIKRPQSGAHSASETTVSITIPME